MKIHESAEDYLERILVLHNEQGRVKNDGYIEIDANGGITLTEKGYKIASSIYERHNILAKCFMKLGVPYDIAYADACKVEHDLSVETFEAIKKHFTKEME